MSALYELKILLDCENRQWQYKLDKTSIRVDGYRRFLSRAQKAKVYALVEVNHLIPSTSSLPGELPESLQSYIDVFSTTNAKQLAPHRDIDLAIELQPGKEPPYGPIYPLSQTELAALREFLEENLEKGFI